MSLLVRAAVLGGLAYVVSRAVRKSQQSLGSSRPVTERLARSTDDDLFDDVLAEERPSTSSV
ncbi:MAG TPA: hypothetical protein VM937_10405 [Burkholderiaceae bacterium]|jgi:hypothetical protein|nr:hypothetical protein [Burkholderiaceae bacterium]